MVIIDHGLQTLTHEVIVPHSGWEPEPNEDSKPRDAEWTTVFKNTSGCLRCAWGQAHAPLAAPRAVHSQGGRSQAPETVHLGTAVPGAAASSCPGKHGRQPSRPQRQSHITVP